MLNLLRKYARKMIVHGLCDPASPPLLGGWDAELVWNRKDVYCKLLEETAALLNINSILFARPAEPYFSIINYLAAQQSADCIQPQDCETRTFLHDIPLVPRATAAALAAALKKRKGLIITGEGILSTGTVSPEQAFVTFSSICFAAYVKFFSDQLQLRSRGAIIPAAAAALLEKALAAYNRLMQAVPGQTGLQQGPFQDKAAVIREIRLAGSLTVKYRLVDSYFGNISCRLADTIFISQTGSSMDELAGAIDPCPVDGSSCAAITASSEFSAHKQILLDTRQSTVLHGHPRFAVIMSLYCEQPDCRSRGLCYKECPQERFIGEIPIVPGEVGTGPTGLCHTLPPAIRGRQGAIVYGHGVFTTGRHDFIEAFHSLVEIEKQCLAAYSRLIRSRPPQRPAQNHFPGGF